MKSKIWIFILLCLLSGLAYGYDVETHKLITKNALEASNLPARLPDLGFADLKSKLPNNTYEFGGAVWCLQGFSRELSILEVIKQGAFCEDTTGGGLASFRYKYHFYDPVHNGSGYLGIFTSSRDWGLETTVIGTQEYSYKDAKDYLYKGLTLPAKSDRDDNLMKTFRTLGHVMHLIQDLGQPQHTRNDSHAKGSLYETYTNRDDIRTKLPFGGYNPVQVTTPDQFWHTANNKGLADYSNRGFVGAESNFRGTSANILPATNYPLPDGSASVIKKQITDADLLGPAGSNQPLTGEIHFISTPVLDSYSGAIDVNPRTSTFSLFDSDLSAMGYAMGFSLNKFTFDEAHKLLIKRAVGYSAGLINYFFRGKMEISLPVEGVYGVVDHNTNPAGFKTIKLKITNVTVNTANANGGEDMSNGQFVVVAKYHLNECYQQNLSGQFLTDKTGAWAYPVCQVGQNYSTTQEYITVSDPLPLTGLQYNSAQDVQATFSQGLIPINATDLYLQVVFKGKLGSEEGAVAVSTKDIAEPNFYTFVNNSDQLCVNGSWVNTNDQTAVKNALAAVGKTINSLGINPTAVDLYFGFNNTGTYYNGIASLPAGGYSRMVVLTDIGANWPLSVQTWGKTSSFNFTYVRSVSPVFNQNINGQFGFTPVTQFRPSALISEPQPTNGFKTNTGIIMYVYIRGYADCSVYTLPAATTLTPITTIQAPFN